MNYEKGKHYGKHYEKHYEKQYCPLFETTRVSPKENWRK